MLWNIYCIIWIGNHSNYITVYNLSFCCRIERHKKRNKMTLKNLAVIFAPTLLRPPQQNGLMEVKRLPGQREAVELLIKNFDTLLTWSKSLITIFKYLKLYNFNYYNFMIIVKIIVTVIIIIYSLRLWVSEWVLCRCFVLMAEGSILKCRRILLYYQ